MRGRPSSWPRRRPAHRIATRRRDRHEQAGEGERNDPPQPMGPSRARPAGRSTISSPAEIRRRRGPDAPPRDDVLSMLVAARDEHGSPLTDPELPGPAVDAPPRRPRDDRHGARLGASTASSHTPRAGAPRDEHGPRRPRPARPETSPGSSCSTRPCKETLRLSRSSRGRPRSARAGAHRRRTISGGRRRAPASTSPTGGRTAGRSQSVPARSASSARVLTVRVVPLRRRPRGAAWGWRSRSTR